MDMRAVFISILASIALSTGAFGQGYEEYLSKADKSYESGDKEAANALYMKAAGEGSAEAHFALAYKYMLPPKESLYHYMEAAKKGHEKALEYALGGLLFQSGSIRTADPQKALDLYLEVKKSYPAIHLADEENKVRIMKMCAEPKGFDAEKFMEKYGVEEDTNADYGVWELAEEASRGGRFGKPDPELVFNLVIRGGWVPAEFESAVEETYKNWKAGVVKEFNICDHVTSGFGQGYCASLKEDEDETERGAKLEKIGERLGQGFEQLLDAANDSAVKFIEAKADCEEGHGGSGRAAWILGSGMEQKNQYLSLIEEVIGGFKPTPKSPLNISDQNLNQTYQEVMKKAKKVNEAEPNVSATPECIKQVQRLWIKYRDDSAKLFVRINPSIDEAAWKSWLTEVRVDQLKSIRELEDNP